MATDAKSTNSSRKMPVLVTCYKCKKYVDIKLTALCSICKNRYELNCDGYPEETYRRMKPESKNKWKCKTCIKKSSDSSNVTLRKKTDIVGKSNYVKLTCPSNENTHMTTPSQHSSSHVLSDCDTSDDSYNTPNKLSKSVDGTVTDLLSTTEMKESISQLTCKLLSTENELENCIMENNDLKEQIAKLTTEIEVLKSLCHSTSILANSPKKSITKRIHSLQNCSMSTPSSPLNSNIETRSTKLISKLQQDIVNLQEQLHKAEAEISKLSKLSKEIGSLTQDVCKDSRTIGKFICTAYKSQTTANLPKRRNHPKRQIHIFGTQQCVGLATALSQSRQNSQYEEYGITAETKPYALSSEILRNCSATKLRPDDKLIIGIGENDYNESILSTQLNNVLHSFDGNTIIVLSAYKNNYLDTIKLNQRMKYICKNYIKCHYVYFTSKNFKDLCHTINHIIDYSDYSDKYLNPREIRRRIACSKPNLNLHINYKTEPRKGTIPYYFERINKKTTLQTSSPIARTNNKQPGTIPYYFPTINRGNTLFRN